MPPRRSSAFWRGCRARSGRCMRPARPGSGSRARRGRAGSMCGSSRRGRSRGHRVTGSRPIVVTRSGWRGCWPPASCGSRSCPTVADERFRDLVRAIEDIRGDLMRARHRLGKFLLRREMRWAGPGSAWTARTCAGCAALRFDDACSQAVLIDYLSGVEMLLGRRAALLAALEQAIPDSRTRHDRAVAVLPRDRHALRRRLVRRDRRLAAVPAPSSSPGSSGSSPASTPLTRNAGRDRSPRPARATPAGCWSRPPTTTATSPPSATSSRAASTDRTPA